MWDNKVNIFNEAEWRDKVVSSYLPLSTNLSNSKSYGKIDSENRGLTTENYPPPQPEKIKKQGQNFYPFNLLYSKKNEVFFTSYYIF